MPKLYYKNEYRGELTEAQATRIRESLDQKPRPSQLTINGELLITRNIEVFKDQMDNDAIPENKEFHDKVARTAKEIAAMRKWSIDQKIDFNITRNFSVKYLLRTGYKNYLGEGWEKNGPDWWWQEFESKYKRENEGQCRALCEVLAEYFQENPEHYWCSAEIYKQFLPEHTARKINNLGIQGSREYQTDSTRDKRQKAELKF